MALVMGNASVMRWADAWVGWKACTKDEKRAEILVGEKAGRLDEEGVGDSAERMGCAAAVPRGCQKVV